MRDLGDAVVVCVANLYLVLSFLIFVAFALSKLSASSRISTYSVLPTEILPVATDRPLLFPDSAGKPVK